MGEDSQEDLAGARASDDGMPSGDRVEAVKVPSKEDFYGLKKRALDLGIWWTLNTAVVVEENAGAIQIKTEDICIKAQEHVRLFNDMFDVMTDLIRQGLQANWDKDFESKTEAQIVQEYEQASKKSYLGDGVYCVFDGVHMTLTAENGISATDTIHLDADVIQALELKFKILRNCIKNMERFQRKNSVGDAAAELKG